MEHWRRNSWKLMENLSTTQIYPSALGTNGTLRQWRGKCRTLGEAALLPTGNSSWTFQFLGEGSGLDLQLQGGDFPLRALHEQGGRNHRSPAGMLQVIQEAKPTKPRDFPAKRPRPRSERLLPLLPEPDQAGLVLQGQPWNPLAEEAVRAGRCPVPAARQPRG